MSGCILRLHWLALKRDRVALALAFVLPIVFFSVFTAIYLETTGESGLPNIRVAVIDLDASDLSRALLAHLESTPGLELAPIRPAGGREEALSLVRRGQVPVAVVIPAGFAAAVDAPAQTAIEVEALEDRSDAPAVLIAAAALDTALARLAVDRAISRFEAMTGFVPVLGEGSAAADSPPVRGRVPVRRVDVMGRPSGQEKNAAVAYLAAGTGVLFLLFTMAGAAGTLLDEEQNGTLERVLDCGLGMGRLLLLKWFFFAILGALQVTIMFVWGWAVFSLNLFTLSHAAGFAVMTVFTAMAAASLGLALATACHSRAQLTGLSTVLILIMSALGGSMFPRFLMSDLLKRIDLFTFNAWALDGYQKVFWYEVPLRALGPQVAVLSAATCVLLLVARRLAFRWEAS